MSTIEPRYFVPLPLKVVIDPHVRRVRYAMAWLVNRVRASLFSCTVQDQQRLAVHPDFLIGLAVGLAVCVIPALLDDALKDWRSSR